MYYRVYLSEGIELEGVVQQDWEDEPSESSLAEVLSGGGLKQLDHRLDGLLAAIKH